MACAGKCPWDTSAHGQTLHEHAHKRSSAGQAQRLALPAQCSCTQHVWELRLSAGSQVSLGSGMHALDICLLAAEVAALRGPDAQQAGGEEPHPHGAPPPRGPTTCQSVGDSGGARAGSCLPLPGSARPLLPLPEHISLSETISLLLLATRYSSAAHACARACTHTQTHTHTRARAQHSQPAELSRCSCGCRRRHT